MNRIRSNAMFHIDMNDDEKKFIEREVLTNLFLMFIDEYRKDSEIDDVFNRKICFEITKTRTNSIRGYLDEYINQYEIHNIEVIQNNCERIIIPRTNQLLEQYSTYKKASFKERIKILFKGSC